MSQSNRKILELEGKVTLLKSEIGALTKIQKEKDILQATYDRGQEIFRTIFEESSFGNKIINDDLTIIKVNKMLTTILGYSESELVGRRIIEFSHPDFLPTWKQLRKELWSESNTRTSFSIDTCLIKKDKSTIWCHVTSILFDEDNERLGYTIIEDITERKRSQRIKDQLAKHEELLLIKDQEHAREQELFKAMIKAQEEERERIAEQLHNGLGQMLYAVKIKLGLVTRRGSGEEDRLLALKEATKLLTESITECRRTAHNLLPRILIDFGLKEAIEDIGKQFRPAIDFKLQFVSMSAVRDKYIEIFLFRTVQELLLNIVKHAEASVASCKVQIGKKAISVSVKDNGKGLEPGALTKKGIGLATMKSRVEQMGGKLKIKSEDAKGTTITIALPHRTS